MHRQQGGMGQKLTSIAVIYHCRYSTWRQRWLWKLFKFRITGASFKVDLPVVVFDLLLSPRPWLHCSTDAGMCWGTRRSWSWACLCPEYFLGGRVRSPCCRNLAPPMWIPRRTRTARRFLNSLKHFTFRHACTGNRRKKSAESSHAVIYQCEMRHLCAQDARNRIVGH